MNEDITYFLHGGDYNPEQWIEHREIWDEDIRLMKKAGCNTVTLGVFSWSSLEIQEDTYNFEWLDTIMDKMADNDINVILATPSAGKPQWLMHRYPEVMLTKSDGVRLLPGQRINHCYTSPVFRQKISNINTKLAERYQNHKALILWHVSNEFCYDCHCDLCQEAFREWLKKKYISLEGLNKKWYTTFWSHTFDNWSQIHSPVPYGDTSIHGLNLDWKRFTTDQLIDYMKEEIEPLRRLTPDIPITTNFMNRTDKIIKVDNQFDHWKIGELLDLVSIDVYPNWDSGRDNYQVALEESFTFDICRSIKGKNFLQMESTPSVTSWMAVNKLKKTGIHQLASILPIARGSESVFYFQWRKSRGGLEKFHGAVVDHCGHEHTRTFNDVVDVGKLLERIQEVKGSITTAEVGIIYDYENSWAISDAAGPREKKDYQEICMEHYEQFYKRGLSVDVINLGVSLSNYKIIVGPMLYMLSIEEAKKIEQFIENGGIFLTTFLSGMVDHNDLCYLGGFPGPLRNVMGIWSEEIETFYDDEHIHIKPVIGLEHFTRDSYIAGFMCDLIHIETAKLLAVYTDDFYKDKPALTLNSFGDGKAYYLSGRAESLFLSEMYDLILKDAKIEYIFDSKIPTGLVVSKRSSRKSDYVFLMNFTSACLKLDIGRDRVVNLVNNDLLSGTIDILPKAILVLKRPLV